MPPFNEPGQRFARSRVGDEQQSRDETMLREYATVDRQRDLRGQIESQDLPVKNRLAEVVTALEESQQRQGIVLLQGQTGSGKSIYSPKAVREALRALGLRDRIVMMQPRKDAASNVAQATAAIMDEELGRGVGFSTSEIRALNSRTKVAVVTPGIFLRYLMSGSLTKDQVGAIIIDELHEGSIDYHLALGLIKQMHDRGDAPLTLLTSATIHKEQIQKYFGITDEDYLRIEGRAHPVDTVYLKSEDTQRLDGREKSYISLTVEQTGKAVRATTGDVLVFLPGKKEIDDTIRELGPIEGMEVLPLYGGLTYKERATILSSRERTKGKRRIIFATNIAETSVTVPGITVVVDSCRQRSVRYNPVTGITEMGTELISKDQAEQRAGRAGRITAGVCYRALTEADFQKLQEHPEAEIRRTNLASLVLRLKSLDIDPEEFPFIDPPKPEAIQAAVKHLTALGAIDEHGKLTELGAQMGEMPFEPSISRMVIEGQKRKCVEAALIIAAFEREGNVLLGPTRRDEAEANGYNEQARRLAARKRVQDLQGRFDRGNSDILKSLNVFAEAIEQGVFEASDRDHSPEGRAAAKRFEAWCARHYIKSTGLAHIAYKLRDYAYHGDVQIDRSVLARQLRAANDADLGSIILASHPDRLLYQSSSGHGMKSYRLVEGGTSDVNMSPGSEAFEAAPSLCVAFDISQGRGTNRGAEVMRNYASGVHPITGAQVREVLPHLVKESPGYVKYNPSTDTVTQIFDLSLNRGSVSLGKETRVVTGPEASAAFASALARGEVDRELYNHNQEAMKVLEDLWTRSRGAVGKIENLAAWYVERLGGASRWAEVSDMKDLLCIDTAEICSQERQAEIDRDCPKTVEIHGTVCTVQYTFTPEKTTGYSSYPEEFSAKMSIPRDRLFDIQQSDIPMIGPKEHMTAPIISVGSGGWGSVENVDITVLKDDADKQRILNAWSRFSQPEPQVINWVPGDPVPVITQRPIAYTTSWRGESVYAHPEIMQMGQRYDARTDEYWSVYAVRFNPDKDNADYYTNAYRRQMEEANKEAARSKAVKEMVPQVTERFEEVRELFGRKRSVLSDRTINDINRQFNEVEALLNARYGALNPEEALRIVERIKDVLNRVGSETWSTPVARKFIEMRDAESDGIYATILVRGGRVYQGGVAVESVIVGNTGRRLIISRDETGAKVLFGWGSDRTQYRLPDGQYAIARDLAAIFQVELSPEYVVQKVTGELTLEAIQSTETVPDDPWGLSSRVSRWNESSPKTVAAPVSVQASSPFGALGQAFVSGRAKPEVAAAARTAEVAPAPQPKPKEVAVEGPASAEDRRLIEGDIAYVKSLVAFARSFGKPRELEPRERPSDTDKAHQRLFEATRSWSEPTREIADLLALPGTKASTLNGKVQDLRRRVEKIVQDNGAVLDRAFAGKSDLERYHAAWQSIPVVITENTNAQEFITADLVTPADLQARVQVKLTERMRDVTAEKITVSDLIEEVLGTI